MNLKIKYLLMGFICGALAILIFAWLSPLTFTQLFTSQIRESEKKLRLLIVSHVNKISALETQQSPMAQMLSERSLTGLSSHIPIYNPSDPGIALEFDWYPAVPEGFEFVIFNDGQCRPYDEKKPPASIISLSKDQLSYAGRYPIGTSGCAQIWSNYKNGVVASDPNTFNFVADPNSRAID